MQLATNTAGAALTTAASTVISMGDVQAGPGAVAVGTLPYVTGVAAAAIVTAQIIRNDTGAVIGSSQAQNTGAGAGQVGPIVVVAPIPAGIGGSLSLQALVGSGTANMAGSATTPATLLALP